MHKHDYELQILEHHIDTLGHVNNATYLALYEEARWDIIANRGFGVKDIQASQTGPVILEVNLKFMKELKVREKIKIETEFQSQVGKISKMTQRIFLANGELASEAVFTFGLFDLKQRKLIEPTAQWLKAIGASQ